MNHHESGVSDGNYQALYETQRQNCKVLRGRIQQLTKQFSEHVRFIKVQILGQLDETPISLNDESISDLHSELTHLFSQAFYKVSPAFEILDQGKELSHNELTIDHVLSRLSVIVGEDIFKYNDVNEFERLCGSIKNAVESKVKNERLCVQCHTTTHFTPYCEQDPITLTKSAHSSTSSGMMASDFSPLSPGDTPDNMGLSCRTEGYRAYLLSTQYETCSTELFQDDTVESFSNIYRADRGCESITTQSPASVFDQEPPTAVAARSNEKPKSEELLEALRQDFPVDDSPDADIASLLSLMRVNDAIAEQPEHQPQQLSQSENPQQPLHLEPVQPSYPTQQTQPTQLEPVCVSSEMSTKEIQSELSESNVKAEVGECRYDGISAIVSLDQPPNEVSTQQRETEDMSTSTPTTPGPFEWQPYTEDEPAPACGLHSEVISHLLRNWTRDNSKINYLLSWVESLGSTLPPDFPSGLQVVRLSSVVRDGFLMLLIPIMRRIAYKHTLNISTRQVAPDASSNNVEPAHPDGPPPVDSFGPIDGFLYDIRIKLVRDTHPDAPQPSPYTNEADSESIENTAEQSFAADFSSSFDSFDREGNIRLRTDGLPHMEIAAEILLGEMDDNLSASQDAAEILIRASQLSLKATAATVPAAAPAPAATWWDFAVKAIIAPPAQAVMSGVAGSNLAIETVATVAGSEEQLLPSPIHSIDAPPIHSPTTTAAAAAAAAAGGGDGAGGGGDGFPATVGSATAGSGENTTKSPSHMVPYNNAWVNLGQAAVVPPLAPPSSSPSRSASGDRISQTTDEPSPTPMGTATPSFSALTCTLLSMAPALNPWAQVRSHHESAESLSERLILGLLSETEALEPGSAGKPPERGHAVAGAVAVNTEPHKLFEEAGANPRPSTGTNSSTPTTSRSSSRDDSGGGGGGGTAVSGSGGARADKIAARLASLRK